MASSLSNLVGNLAKEIHEIKFKHGHDNKKCETCEINYKDRDCCLKYTKFKGDLIVYK